MYTADENKTCDVNSDVKYIESELMVEMPDDPDTIVKWCKPLNAIVGKISKEAYKKYWLNNYSTKKRSSKDRKLILDAVNNKLNNGLMNLEDFVIMFVKGKDSAKEKYKLLKEMGYDNIAEKIKKEYPKEFVKKEN